MDLRYGVGLLVEPLRHLYRHRELSWELTRREVLDRYAGHLLGVIWAVGHPLVLVMVYLVLFRFVFQVRLGSAGDLPLDYSVYLLAGFIPWLSCQEAMNKAAVAVSGSSNLVKQVIFPLEVLPVKAVLGSLFTQLVGSILLVLYVLISTGTMPPTYVLLPLLWVAQVLALVGLSFVLSSLGTYFPDVRDMVQVFCSIGVYLMPIVYLPAWVPGPLRPLLYLNPFSYLGWCYQDVCFFGRFEHPWAWPVFFGGAACAFYFGYYLFQKLKVHFASVL